MILLAGLVAVVVFAVATSHSDAASLATAQPPAPKAPPTPSTQAPQRPQQSLTSPFPEADSVAWARFVRIMAAALPNTITSSGNLGTFSIGMRRLEDLGLVRDCRTVVESGRSRVVGEWVPPYSLGLFLSDPALQYRVFVASTRDHRKTILERHKDAIGKELHGKRVTLSGLLAVAKQAGLGGLGAWLRSEEDRLQHPHTTAAFIKTTGLF